MTIRSIRIAAFAAALFSLAPLPGARAAATADAASFDPRAAYGIYVITGERDASTWQRVMSADGIAGVALTASWSDLEPNQGAYSWSALDSRIAAAKQANRKVGLRLLPGVTSPEWLFAKGAKRFSFMDENPNHGASGAKQGQRNQTYGKNLSLPVPWDEPFLAAWERFVMAAGEHLKDAPLAMVHVTGPNKHSAEMILPHTPNDVSRWKELGYSKDKLIDAWRRCVDIYARAFPNRALVLNLSPTIDDDNVTVEVVKYAYGRYGKRIFLQNNILLADSNDRRVDWGILKEYAAKTTIGFQRQLLRQGKRDDSAAAGTGAEPDDTPASATPAAPRTSRHGGGGGRGGGRGGRRAEARNAAPAGDEDRTQARETNFSGMFERGISLGARYFEVGAAEVRDFPDQVKAAAEKLRPKN
jgi:hypothetical protein